MTPSVFIYILFIYLGAKCSNGWAVDHFKSRKWILVVIASACSWEWIERACRWFQCCLTGPSWGPRSIKPLTILTSLSSWNHVIMLSLFLCLPGFVPVSCFTPLRSKDRSHKHISASSNSAHFRHASLEDTTHSQPRSMASISISDLLNPPHQQHSHKGAANQDSIEPLEHDDSSNVLFRNAASWLGRWLSTEWYIVTMLFLFFVVCTIFAVSIVHLCVKKFSKLFHFLQVWP